MKVKIRSNYIGFFLVTILIAITVLCIPKTIYANNVDIETEKLSDKYIEWLNLPEEERNNTIAPQMYVKNIENTGVTKRTTLSFNLGASSRYSLRDDISNLKIKDQQQTEECWAFATTTQLESYLLLNKNKNVEFSPRHMEYSTAMTFIDGTNTGAFYREVDSGGNFYYSYGYLTSGKGPVLESDMPFVNTSAQIYLNDIEGKTVQAQLEEYRVFSPIYKEKINGQIVYSNGQSGEDRVEYTEIQVNNYRNEIKNHIVRYGAVGSITASNSHQFYSNESNYISSKAYNCDDNSAQANHAVAIIGWDDSYDKSNFNANHRPTKNGAWIIQNSYGTQRTGINGNTYSVFDNGLLYISYEDFLIEQTMFGIIELDDVDYDNIYQYDELGHNAAIPITGSQAFAANVYSKNSNKEYITEIGLYTNETENCTYDIYINAENSQLDTNSMQHIKTIQGTSSSYITVELEKPIKITGSKFAIAIKYTTEDSYTDIPIEAKIDKEIYEYDAWYSATANEGESYISQNGVEWFDGNNKSEVNVNGVINFNNCIKVFTCNNIDFTITSSKYNISNSMISNVSPNTSITDFINNFTTNGTIQVFDKTGNIINSGNIATGMQLKLEDTNQYYQISVRGDINGDGKISATDLLILKQVITGITSVKGSNLQAADLNNKDGVTITDLLLMKQAMCRLINL